MSLLTNFLLVLVLLAAGLGALQEARAPAPRVARAVDASKASATTSSATASTTTTAATAGATTSATTSSATTTMRVTTAAPASSSSSSAPTPAATTTTIMTSSSSATTTAVATPATTSPTPARASGAHATTTTIKTSATVSSGAVGGAPVLVSQVHTVETVKSDGVLARTTAVDSVKVETLPSGASAAVAGSAALHALENASDAATSRPSTKQTTSTLLIDATPSLAGNKAVAVASRVNETLRVEPVPEPGDLSGDPNALPDPLITRPSSLDAGVTEGDDAGDYSLDAMLTTHLKDAGDLDDEEAHSQQHVESEKFSSKHDDDDDDDDDDGSSALQQSGKQSAQLRAWEAEQELEANKAAALHSEADALEALLADVGAADEPAEPSSNASAPTPASSEFDKTSKATSFWGHFEKTTTTTVTTATEPSEGGAGTIASLADVLAQCQTALPEKFEDCSSAGVVLKGHVDVDSEDESDAQLTDTVISGSSRFDIGFADTKGIRTTMEDEMVVYGTFRDKPDEDYVAVFDGHGGSEASAVAAEELHELLAVHLDEAEFDGQPGAALRRAFESCQRTIEQAEPTIQSGTTAVVAFFQGERGWIANAGDARAVLCRRRPDGGHADVEAVRVTTDHKPALPAEEARIKAAGGFVTRQQTKRGEVSRVCAILGVARALGDTFLQPMVTCVPDVFEINLAEHDVLILACDGLWDVVSDHEAALVALSTDDSGVAATRLRDFAFARGSDDNISVLVVRLKGGKGMA